MYVCVCVDIHLFTYCNTNLHHYYPYIQMHLYVVLGSLGYLENCVGTIRYHPQQPLQNKDSLYICIQTQTTDSIMGRHTGTAGEPRLNWVLVKDLI